MRNKNLYYLGAISLLPFFIIIAGGLGSTTNFWQVDSWIWDYIKNLRSENFTKLIKFITHFADTWFLIILVILIVVLLIFKRKVKSGLWLAISVLLGTVALNKTLKYFFKRPRPFYNNYIDNLIEVREYSFPSGHAMASIIVYLLLAYLLTKHLKNKTLKFMIVFLSIIFSIIISFTRLYLGVHYPTDLIAGFSLGLSWALLAIVIYRKVVNNESKKS